MLWASNPKETLGGTTGTKISKIPGISPMKLSLLPFSQAHTTCIQRSQPEWGLRFWSSQTGFCLLHHPPRGHHAKPTIRGKSTLRRSWKQCSLPTTPIPDLLASFEILFLNHYGWFVWSAVQHFLFTHALK